MHVHEQAYTHAHITHMDTHTHTHTHTHHACGHTHARTHHARGHTHRHTHTYTHTRTQPSCPVVCPHMLAVQITRQPTSFAFPASWSCPSIAALGRDPSFGPDSRAVCLPSCAQGAARGMRTARCAGGVSALRPHSASSLAAESLCYCSALMWLTTCRCTGAVARTHSHIHTQDVSGVANEQLVLAQQRQRPRS